MLPIHEPRSKFGKWLLKYRFLIIILTFVIVIPVAFVIALYVGDYLKYRSVSFDDTLISDFNSTYITTEDTTLHEEINLETNDLIIKIKLKSILVPEYYDDTNGAYTFRAKYQPKSGRTVSALTTTMILQTDWINMKSNPKNLNLTESYSSIQIISFNHILPSYPLWFVTVQRPHLYVKISYHLTIGMSQEEIKTFYFKTDLTNLIPSDITDLNNE